MKQTTTITFALAALLAVGQGLAQTNRSADVQLKAAEHKQQVEGDLKGAIDDYKKLAEGKDRAVAAKALIRLAECYEKLGQADARKAYERVVREFSDQIESVTVARGRLSVPPLTNGSEAKQAARQVWKLRQDQDASESLPSPDGRWMAYTDWSTGDLGLHDLMTGTDRRLTNTGGWQAGGDYAEAPLISPDGKEVIYTWEPAKGFKTELRILPLNATEKIQPRTVFRGGTSQEYIVPRGWTRDGKQVLVIHNLPDRTSQLGMLSISDGTIRVIKSVTWQNVNASLSPDGRYVAYDLPTDAKTGARDIFLIAVDGSLEAPLAQGAPNDIKPIWSADGSRVLFLSNRTGNFSLWSQTVQNGKIIGRPELIRPDIGNVSLLGPTRDGAIQYIGGAGGGSTRTNIYIAELSSDMKVVIAPAFATENFLNSNVGPSWSPDGQYIAYFSARTGVGSVYIRSMNTGDEWRVPMDMPTGPVFGSGPMWFPDGRSVLVSTRQLQRAGVVVFVRADIRSGATEVLHETRMTLQGLALSPDGKALFYSGRYPDDPDNQGRIVRFDVVAAAKRI
jgi:Tol biopolymer transport system component